VEYSESFKAQMVKKMLPPSGKSAGAVEQETGIPQPTLSRWLRESCRPKGMSRSKKRTAAEKLQALLAASGLEDAKLGEWLRREGLHEAVLAQWRADAEAALTDASGRRRPSADARRIKELERELGRKEKALAEVAALLVLKKKASGIWGDEDDSTRERSER
jgi:transposase-like protein